MSTFEVVDGQVGVWAENNSQYPWDPTFGQKRTEIEQSLVSHQTVETNPVENVLVAMKAVGVDVAVISPGLMYGYDPAYAIEAALNWPGKFISMPRINHLHSDTQELAANWRSQPGVVGARVIFLTEEDRESLRAGRHDALFSACEEHEVPLSLFCPYVLEEVYSVAVRYPALPLMIDHFGLPQPPFMEPDSEPFRALPQLIRLAELPNVVVKLSGAPTLSTQPYPFSDVWPHLHRVVEGFGPERLVWASDYQRVKNHNYSESLMFIAGTNELSEADKEWILGKSARTFLRWGNA